MGEFVERDVVWVGFDVMERFAVDVFREGKGLSVVARPCSSVLMSAGMWPAL